MNDVANTLEIDNRPELTPHEVVPVVTVMSDRSLRVEASQINPLDVHALLLGGADAVLRRVIERGSASAILLNDIVARYKGIDGPTLAKIRDVIGRPSE